ncbi:hypothetical protein DEO72_LG8g1786 [Vigna unguiculata]|uniref:Uncharacterized protein n=1 Tax=Vigna unguiculata TaxID=3917 RepID=A0A4D6MQD0_VIGUN|nr:hypothetical protein DEO72_LG8g1786 [Vigna unguiculata]
MGERGSRASEKELAQARLHGLQLFLGLTQASGPSLSEIGVKHVAFYGLWSEMTSLELWLGYGWVQMDCPPQWFADEFGRPGTLRTMFVFGNSTWRYGV